MGTPLSALRPPREQSATSTSTSDKPPPISHARVQLLGPPRQAPATVAGLHTRLPRLTIKDVPRLDFSCKAFRDANGHPTGRQDEPSKNILRTRDGPHSISRARKEELPADVLPGVFSNYSPIITAVRRNATSSPERSPKKLRSPGKIAESGESGESTSSTSSASSIRSASSAKTAKSGNASQCSRPMEAEREGFLMLQFVQLLKAAKSDLQFQSDLKLEFENYREPLKALVRLKNKMDFDLFEAAFHERFNAIAWVWICHENSLCVSDFRNIFGQALIDYAVPLIEQGKRIDIAVLLGWNVLQNRQLWRDQDMRMETNHSLVSPIRPKFSFTS